MALQHKLLGKSVHLDTTTLSLYGTSYEDVAAATLRQLMNEHAQP
jgi:hypothetical protein